MDNLSDLELLLVQSLVSENLDDIAADRTALSTTVRLGFDQRFAEEWTVTLDSSVSRFGATRDSLNVSGLDPYRDFYLDLQVRSENALGQGNFGSVQMRYYRSDTTTSSGLYFTNRFAFGERWWLYPRLSVDRSRFDPGAQEQLRIKPSLRLDFRQSRRFRLELEAGYEWTTRKMVSSNLDMQGLVVIAGWRAMF